MVWNLINNVYTGKKLEKVAQIRIKNKDNFSIQLLYDRVHDWFVEEGWGASSNHEFEERMFRLVENPNNTKNFKVEWRFRRQVTPYITLTWDIDIIMLQIKDAEIIHQGKKIKTNNCDCDLHMIVRIVYDYGGAWSKHWLLKHFSVIFPKRIYRDEIEEYKLRAYRDAYAFQQHVKDYWKFNRWIEEPEIGSYDRPLGLPDHEEK